MRLHVTNTLNTAARSNYLDWKFYRYYDSPKSKTEYNDVFLDFYSLIVFDLLRMATSNKVEAEVWHNNTEMRLNPDSANQPLSSIVRIRRNNLISILSTLPLYCLCLCLCLCLCQIKGWLGIFQHLEIVAFSIIIFFYSSFSFYTSSTITTVSHIKSFF